MGIISKLFTIVSALIFELLVLGIGSQMLLGTSHGALNQPFDRLVIGSQMLLGSSHGAMLDTNFRRHERLVAFVEYHNHPSPDSKAAFDEEMRMMHKHEDWKFYLCLGLFLIVNGAGIYYYWNYGNRKVLA